MSGFAPPPVSSHQGPAQGFTPPPVSSHQGEVDQPSALQRGVSAFWEFTGKPIMDLMAGASRNPEKAAQAEQNFKNLVHGIANEPQRVVDELGKAGNAFMKGDISGGLRHTGGAVPLVGGPALQVADDIDKGKIPEAIGHSLGMIAPFAAGPVLEAGQGAAEAGVNAVKNAGGATLDALTAPGTRDVIGIFSPRAKNALNVVARAKEALAKGQPEATAAPAAPAAMTPGQAYAAVHDIPWDKLAPQEQALIENSVRFQAEQAAQPASAPQSVSTPVVAPTTPVAPPLSLADQIAAEVRARQGTPAEAPAAPLNLPPIPESASIRGPLRPPVGLADYLARVQQETLQPPASLSQTSTAPVAAPEVAPPATAPPRTLAQVEAGMARTGPAQTEAPRSIYDANGEIKSPELRAAENTSSNTQAKALRFAQVLYGEGFSAEDIGNMKMGDFDAITEGLKAKGLLDAKETTPKSSIPMIKDQLKALEKQSGKPGPPEGAQPFQEPTMEEFAKMTQEQQQQALRDMMERSGTLPKANK